MKKEVLKEISKDLNWKEKIIVKLFPKITIKIYGLASKRMFNNINSI
jgi:hypothetical protein